MKKIILATALTLLSTSTIAGFFEYKPFSGHGKECDNEPDKNGVTLCTSSKSGKGYWKYKGKYYKEYPEYGSTVPDKILRFNYNIVPFFAGEWGDCSPLKDEYDVSSCYSTIKGLYYTDGYTFYKDHPFKRVNSKEAI